MRMLVLALAVAMGPSVAAAQRQARGRQASAARRSALDEAAQRGLDRGFVARLTAEANAHRREAVRQRGGIFLRIAGGNHQGEVVVHSDRDVTAFLDMSDPAHPEFDPEAEVEEEAANAIPIARRAHVLVVPNSRREHLTPRLGGNVHLADLEFGAKMLRSAQQIAQRLGIKNPDIFITDSSRVMIGQLHVHIVGEKTRPY
jgi:diadenosine tetraphosphate (Ap4A) HIT family hydrolase